MEALAGGLVELDVEGIAHEFAALAPFVLLDDGLLGGVEDTVETPRV
jgi:hypothetical protein